jgi:hypothetical protein
VPGSCKILTVVALLFECSLSPYLVPVYWQVQLCRKLHLLHRSLVFAVVVKQKQQEVDPQLFSSVRFALLSANETEWTAGLLATVAAAIRTGQQNMTGSRLQSDSSAAGPAAQLEMRWYA